MRQSKQFGLLTVVGLLWLLSGCGGGDGGAVETTETLTTGTNVAKLKAGEVLTIPVEAINDNVTPFTVEYAGTCVSITTSSSDITVIPGATAPCVEDITVVAGNLSKTITLNVYDPMTMDIGEGLLISYVNTFTEKWNDSGSGGSQDVKFWQTDVSALEAGWYPVGSYVQANYGNVNATKDVPIIVVKDTSQAQNLLAAPLSYQAIWNDSGSGANNDGSIWKPICPDGYVSLGSWVMGSIGGGNGWAEPDPDAMRCVAERFTTPGTVGPREYYDNDTGANTNLGVFKVGGSILGASPDGRAALMARALVGCPNWDAPSCDLATFNLLLVPMPVMDSSDDGNQEPQLSGFGPLQVTGARFSSSVRLPFTLIPAEDPQCGDITICGAAAGRVDNNVQNTPFYYIQREETYTGLGSAVDNRQGVAPVDLGPYTYTNAFSQTEASSFSQEIGISISVDGNATFLGTGTSYGVELSTKLAWSQSTSSTYSQAQTTAFGPFQVDSGSFGQVIQVTTQFRGFSEEGVISGTAFSAGQNTAKFLRYPLN